jgi:hypothetical protein
MRRFIYIVTPDALYFDPRGQHFATAANPHLTMLRGDRNALQAQVGMRAKERAQRALSDLFRTPAD